MADKILKPEEIQDTPLPNQGVTSPVNNSTPSDIQEPTQIKDVNIQTPVIANETISSSLDTLSKRILATFNFAKSGALQIGEYINGVSGDIKISPLGFLARNRRGETTVGIDGETGNAVFKGTVKAGSLISGSLILGGQDNRDGTFLLRDANARNVILGDKLGHHYFNTSGVELIKVDSAGFHAYDLAGAQLLSIDSGGVLLRDSSNNFLFGQVSNGMAFQNNKWMYFFKNGGSGSGAGIQMGSGNLFSFFNDSGAAEIRTSATGGNINFIAQKVWVAEVKVMDFTSVELKKQQLSPLLKDTELYIQMRVPKFGLWILQK